MEENDMAVYEITFSPTGGTQKVSTLFTRAFYTPSERIDLTDGALDFSAFHFDPADVCVVSVPSYGGRMPAAASERLQKMTGSGTRAILIAVYGNRAYEDTLLEMQDVLTQSGFTCIAAVAALAEHSIVRTLAAGRPDDSDARELADFARQIRAKLDAHACTTALSLPGNRPYRPFGGGMKPVTDASCARCGLCALRCPVQAIPRDQPQLTDTDQCISCMRCIAICPKKARALDPAAFVILSEKLTRLCGEAKKNELFC
jgi:ferredoxin